MSAHLRSIDAAALAAMPILEPFAPAAAEVRRASDLTGEVRVLTCGSVDDGKSTLIGRLLWDASDLFEDQREAVERHGRTVAGGQHFDYSLLVDGLVAEREQGITIDIAWRYFDSADRRFVIIDSPGHEQYTRNMASGASHADVAVMLIDARHGIKTQTRRHAALLDLFGVRTVVLAVNKMDLVGFDESCFRTIAREFEELAVGFAFDAAVAIPVSAVGGDNVAQASAAMAWYAGPTLLDVIRGARSAESRRQAPFRMPVQMVLRDGQDFRGLAGTITSGTLAVGDVIADVVSGQTARVARIATMGGDLDQAVAGAAVAIVASKDLDLSRGAVLSGSTHQARRAVRLEARLVWLSETPFDIDRGYLVRTATDLVPLTALAITARLDLASLARIDTETCGVNDIVEASMELGRPTAVDSFADVPGTGTILIVDAIDGSTVAGGVVGSVHETASKNAGTALVIDRALLASGLCHDLGDTIEDRIEFERRARELALLFQRTGVRVRLELG
ncbi:MAG: GTP-binding protein [Hyphomicrobiaceae bacterium]|nr:GTP-binding protein [Hyphomicrobiaceae bacterium]